jgi:excisionase family DNA binding protein
MDRLLSIDDVAEYLGVSKRWVYEEARMGRLPGMLIARSYRFRREDLEAFVDGFRLSPAPGSS